MRLFTYLVLLNLVVCGLIYYLFSGHHVEPIWIVNAFACSAFWAFAGVWFSRLCRLRHSFLVANPSAFLAYVTSLSLDHFVKVQFGWGYSGSESGGTGNPERLIFGLIGYFTSGTILCVLVTTLTIGLLGDRWIMGKPGDQHRPVS